MASRTFCAQTLANTRHLFVWTLQRVDCSFAWTVVPRRTREACGLVKLVVKCSRLTFEFKPKSFSRDPRIASELTQIFSLIAGPIFGQHDSNTWIPDLQDKKSRDHNREVVRYQCRNSNLPGKPAAQTWPHAGNKNQVYIGYIHMADRCPLCTFPPDTKLFVN